jgi:hypothetical protein
MTLTAIRGEGAVRVGPDGTGYEIGPIAGHARAPPDTPARYVAAARRTGGGRRPAGLDAGIGERAQPH